MQGENLKQAEEYNDGQKGNGDFLHVMGNLVGEHVPKLHCVCQLQIDNGFYTALRRTENQAQGKNCQNRTDGTKGDQTEAVIRSVAVITDGGDADTEGHDERNGHRTGSHAAGVKGNGTEIRFDKEQEAKADDIKYHQQGTKRNVQEHTDDGDHKEQTNANGNGKNQRAVGNGRHQLGEHL